MKKIGACILIALLGGTALYQKYSEPPSYTYTYDSFPEIDETATYDVYTHDPNDIHVEEIDETASYTPWVSGTEQSESSDHTFGVWIACTGTDIWCSNIKRPDGTVIGQLTVQEIHHMDGTHVIQFIEKMNCTDENLVPLVPARWRTAAWTYTKQLPGESNPPNSYVQQGLGCDGAPYDFDPVRIEEKASLPPLLAAAAARRSSV